VASVVRSRKAAPRSTTSAQLKGAWLTLTSNVVTTAVQAASVRAQIAATEDVNRAQHKVLEVLRTQEKLGGAAGSAVLQQQAQVAQALADLPPLRKQLAQTEDQLAVLIGRFPSNAHLPMLKLDELHLPEHLPLSLPSRLVRQRPDIRAAAAQLHAASAAIGVATANQLPQITITGDIGTIATDPGKLLSPGGGIWSLSGGLLQPIFHGGQLLHQKRAAVAAYEQAAADYRSTVLNAFQNVADALHAIDQDADALNAQLAAEQAAHRSYQISRQQYRDGAVSYTAMLQSSLTWQQARVKLAQAQADRYADTAALFQALGGGWWKRNDDASRTASSAPAAPSSTATVAD
jgi:efflux transporter, outer membrane factor (OMF) lipoprotein, NodT family